MTKQKIGIIGCGAWGVAISKVFAKNGHEVLIWCHDKKIADELNLKHTHFILPDLKIPEEIKATVDLEQVIKNSDYLVLAVASNFIDILDEIKKYYIPKTPILSLIKGLLENKDTIFVSEYIQAKLGKNIPLSILSGPNLAIEIAHEMLAATVVASTDEALAEKWQMLLSNQYFRAYRALDTRGVELGGILKNIIAIAAGAIDGLNLGTNAKSALMTRGLQEIIRFGVFFGAKEKTFFGLSGLGDLITTCSSPQSRNWQVGYNLAKSHIYPDFTNAHAKIAEGVKSAKIVYSIAKEKKIEMPITNEIYQVLYEKKNLKEALNNLMLRGLKHE